MMRPLPQEEQGNVTVSQLLEAAREQVRALKPRARSFGDFSSVGGVLRSLSAPSNSGSDFSASGHHSPPEDKLQARKQRSGKALPSQAASSMYELLLPASNRRLFSWLLLWTCLILIAMFGLSYASKIRGQPRHAVVPQRNQSGTLVIYTYSNTDLEYERNLHFLVSHGMWEGDGCDYLIIIQQGNGAEPGKPIPALPANARYVYHENRCFDWGTFGWAINSGIQDTSGYKYIILMNSSVRGPFLPPYWPETIHWSRIFTSRLAGKVKLVGSTISCEPAYKGGDIWSEKRQTPHVQSYVVATDQVGLKVLLDDPHVFDCFENIHDAVWHAELGSSLAMFRANYTLDSLMLRYQDMDWRDPRNAACNAGKNPYAEYAYDGVSLSPMEVVFIKVKRFTVDAQWTAQHAAVTYDSWLSRKGVPGMVNANDYELFKEKYRLGKIFTMQQRGSACFDLNYYRTHSHDLASHSDQDAWRHFLEHGQFEGRHFRFNCSDKLSKIGVAKAAVKNVLDNPREMTDLPGEEKAEMDHAIEEIRSLEEDDVRQLHRHIKTRAEQANEQGQQDEQQQQQPEQEQQQQDSGQQQTEAAEQHQDSDNQQQQESETQQTETSNSAGDDANGGDANAAEAVPVMPSGES